MCPIAACYKQKMEIPELHGWNITFKVKRDFVQTDQIYYFADPFVGEPHVHISVPSTVEGCGSFVLDLAIEYKNKTHKVKCEHKPGTWSNTWHVPIGPLYIMMFDKTEVGTQLTYLTVVGRVTTLRTGEGWLMRIDEAPHNTVLFEVGSSEERFRQGMLTSHEAPSMKEEYRKQMEEHDWQHEIDVAVHNADVVLMTASRRSPEELMTVYRKFASVMSNWSQTVLAAKHQGPMPNPCREILLDDKAILVEKDKLAALWNERFEKAIALDHVEPFKVVKKRCGDNDNLWAQFMDPKLGEPHKPEEKKPTYDPNLPRGGFF